MADRNDLNNILNAKKELSQPIESVFFNEVMTAVLTELNPEINQTKTDITFDFDEIGQIKTVRNYMHNIFLNLVSNAIKFRKSETNAQINIWTEKANGHLKIYFEDNGIGIDMKRYRTQVFGLYKKFNFNTNGKGMWLFMIKNQISALNGTIELESTTDKGSTFIITLPLVPEQKPKESVETTN